VGVKWRPQERQDENVALPRIGGRIEVRRNGTVLRGTIHYVDRLQVLVKCDDGSWTSLRVGRDPFRIVEP
jgi:hypothetical protein